MNELIGPGLPTGEGAGATLSRVHSGGQSGVDQAALRAAKACGLTTGGYACRGWLVEAHDGKGNVVAPWLGTEFGLVESPESGYPARTRLNVRDTEATLWIGDPSSPGGRVTLKACRTFDRPYLIVTDPRRPTPEMVAAWLVENGVKVLNCAGHRESSRPGIGDRAERYLLDVFAALGHLVS